MELSESCMAGTGAIHLGLCWLGKIAGNRKPHGLSLLHFMSSDSCRQHCMSGS